MYLALNGRHPQPGESQANFSAPTLNATRMPSRSRGVKFRFTRGGAPFGAYLEIAEGSYVELFEQAGRGATANPAIGHFCLETDDLDRVMAALRKRGVDFSDKKLGCDHTYQIWLTDPDGYRFEVHQYTPESLQHHGGEVEADW